MAVLPVMVRAEAVAKKVEAFASGVPDRGLRLVEDKSEFGHHSAGPRQRLGRVTTAENDEVVGIGDDVRSVDFSSSGAAPMLREAVHVQIGEQWADYAALRRSLLAVLASCHAPRSIVIALLNRRFEPQLDQPQHMPVDNAPRHR